MNYGIQKRSKILRKQDIYYIEEHAGGRGDVGAIIYKTRDKEEAKRKAHLLRKRNKNYGYRVGKLRKNIWR